MKSWVCFVVVVVTLFLVTTSNGDLMHNNNNLDLDEEAFGTKWAFLVAGSKGYENYRHQSDVCHAYQLLKNGGLKDENIIVMMFDDIAYHEENPFPGALFNHPNGPNVYLGVPKDYTGNNATLSNFFGVLNGDKGAIQGGSGKVLNTQPQDTIFIYLSDHGSTYEFGMPDDSVLYGDELVRALKAKFQANAYQKLVIYIESCDSGSMLQDFLSDEVVNIYATTAANISENSVAYYCPYLDDENDILSNFTTCLGDLYSISWMEDSENNDRTNETLQQQYITVRDRTTYSHVMQYGNMAMASDFLVTYFGVSTTNGTTTHHDHLYQHSNKMMERSINQEDVHLLYLKLKLKKAPDGLKKLKAQNELDVEIAHRKYVDNNVHLIWNLLLGEETSSTMMTYGSDTKRFVHWDCLRMMNKIYEYHCGVLSTYGLKYSRTFGNICKIGISEKQMIATTTQVCPKKNNSSYARPLSFLWACSLYIVFSFLLSI